MGDADRKARYAGGAAVMLLSLAIASAGPVRTARGDDEQTPALSGSWRNSAGDGGRAAIERAIDAAIDDMFALAKPVARSRLRESNPPIPSLTINLSAGSAHVDIGHGRNYDMPLGQWRAAHSATGDAIQVRQSVLSNGALKVESRTDQGSARQIFRVAEDGSLRQDVRIHAERLPQDVRFTLRYRRSQ